MKAPFRFQWFEYKLPFAELLQLAKETAASQPAELKSFPSEILRKVPQLPTLLSKQAFTGDTARIYLKTGLQPPAEATQLSTYSVDLLLSLLPVAQLTDAIACELVRRIDTLSSVESAVAWFHTHNSAFEKKITPTTIPSLETLTCFLRWSNERNQGEDWIIPESQRLLTNSCITLDPALDVYTELSWKPISWFSLIKPIESFLRPCVPVMSPAQFERLIAANCLLSYVLVSGINKLTLKSALNKLQLGTLTYRQAASIAKSASELNLRIPPAVFNKLVQEVDTQSISDVLAVAPLLPYSNRNAVVKLMLSRAAEGTTEERIEVLHFLCTNNFRTPARRALQSEVLEEMPNISWKGLIAALACTSWVSPAFALTCARCIANKVASVSLQEFETLIGLVGKLEKPQIQPILDEAIRTEVLKRINYLDPMGVTSCFHHFGYVKFTPQVLVPLQHRIMDAHEEMEEITFPWRHSYFIIRDSKYFILKNRELNKQNQQSLTVMCISALYSRYYIGEFKEVLMLYTEALCQRYLLELSPKHRANLFFVLSYPENFEPRLIPYVKKMYELFVREERLPRRVWTARQFAILNYRSNGVYFDT